MIPGPTHLDKLILKELSKDVVEITDSNFIEKYSLLLKDLKEVFDVTGQAYVTGGSGILSMEMSIVNTLKENDKVLIITNGYFGNIFIDICRRKKLNIDILKEDNGNVVKIEDIENKLNSNHYSAVLVTHIETSTGVCMDIGEIGKLLKDKKNTLLIVDAISSIGGVDISLKRMGIDILIGGSQKAIGAPPGLSIILTSEKALSRREELGTLENYYLDFLNWNPVMENPQNVFSTPPINLILALKVAIDIIKKEGFENRYKRHRDMGLEIRESLSNFGIKSFASKGNESSTVSCFLYPENIEDEVFREMMRKEGVIVSGGLGNLKGKIFRIGHMGNISNDIIKKTINVVESCLYNLKNCN